MTLDLHNFFKHFDETNPKHVAAVEELEKTLEKKAPEEMDDTANWVRIYRSKPDKPKSNILGGNWWWLHVVTKTEIKRRKKSVL